MIEKVDYANPQAMAIVLGCMTGVETKVVAKPADGRGLSA